MPTSDHQGPIGIVYIKYASGKILESVEEVMIQDYLKCKLSQSQMHVPRPSWDRPETLLRPSKMRI